MRIAVISNVNLDLLRQTLSKDNELYIQEGYGQWIREAINPSEPFKKFNPEAIFVLLDGTALLEEINSVDEVEQELQMAIRYCMQLATIFSSIPIFISNIDIAPKKIIMGDRIRPEHYFMNFWENLLEQCVNDKANIHLFDLRAIIEEYGRGNFYSDKMWYMGSIPYSVKAISCLSDAIRLKVKCHSTMRKKVLVLDLDNTLWGGVLGEDGFDGILISRSLLGATYRDTQLRVKELADSGILLAIVSKNDESDVRRILTEHPQMVLHVDDFVAIYANWDAKAHNIAKLANTLNLGLDSFVFLDDNPVEREEVRMALPGITVAEFPGDVSNLPSTIRKIAEKYFFTARLTKEDLSKTYQYKQEIKRQVALNNALSIEDYLLSLQIRIVLQEMQDAQLERVAQLTQKTNQFNLMTSRYSTEQLIAYKAKKSNYIYVATVSDRYGDNGLVFVLMVSVNEDKAQIDNLLMSCRVMGRHIEDTVITAVEEELRKNGIKQIMARYIPTAKNKPVVNLLERLDYQLINTDMNNIKYYNRYLEEECHQRKVLFDVKWWQ